MGRKSRITKTTAGQMSIRVEYPVAIWNVLEAFAEEMKIPLESALRMMLGQISREFSNGNATFLSGDFQDALRRVRERNFGIVTQTAGSIDTSKLHRSDRVKSGFTGVYANGKGFRAQARNKLLGTFPTAEAAAWRRYVYFKENGLPYGELEIEMDRWRSGEAGGGPYRGTDEELIAEIRNYSRSVGTYEEIFGPNGVNEPQRKVSPVSSRSKKAEAVLDLSAKDVEEAEEVREVEKSPSGDLVPAGGVPASIFDD